MAAERKQSADAAHVQLQYELREGREYTVELEAVSITEGQRLEAEVNRLQTELPRADRLCSRVRAFVELEDLRAQLAAQAGVGAEAQLTSEGVPS